MRSGVKGCCNKRLIYANGKESGSSISLRGENMVLYAMVRSLKAGKEGLHGAAGPRT
jgi:hypothetical protein